MPIARSAFAGRSTGVNRTATGQLLSSSAAVVAGSASGGGNDDPNFRYLRTAASGSGSGMDWNNAAAWSTVTFTRGLTYYLADGSYGGRTLSTVVSGTTPITIVKATAADHGTNTGWVATDGDGLATFTSTMTISSGYWTISGNNGGVLPSDTAVGLKFAAPVNMSSTNALIKECQQQTSSTGMNFNNGATSCTVQRCLFYDFSTLSSSQLAVINFDGGSTGCIVERCLIRDFGNTPVGEGGMDVFQVWGDGNIIRYNEVFNFDHSPYDVAQGGNHSDFIQVWGGAQSQNHIIEGNYVHDCDCQGGALENKLGGTVTSTITNWTFRNNIFVRMTGTMFSGVPNTKWYNNLWYDCGASQGNALMLYTTTGESDSSGTVIVNNAFSTNTNGHLGTGGTASLPSAANFHHNFFATTNGSNGANAVVGGNPQWANTATGDFHPSASSVLKNVGADLSSTGFSIDADGVTRDATWDIGPYVCP